MTPSIRFEFVPLGSMLDPKPRVIAVDVGNRCVPGVIDHHFQEVESECAASLVTTQPKLVLDHLKAHPPTTLVIVTHLDPDLDAVASAYLVQALARTGELPPGAHALADYVRDVDSGLPPPDLDAPSSLWALYLAMTEQYERLARRAPVEARAQHYLERGFALLDQVVALAPRWKQCLRLPDDLPGWEAERRFVHESRAVYPADVANARRFSIVLPCPGGTEREVPGLRAVNPSSMMFKHLARAEGYTFTHVVYPAGTSKAGPDSDRHVIAVAPERGVWLRGLGRALEAKEFEVRALKLMTRPPPSRWADVTNNDPWYDGRSPLHGFTIVDSPRGGTVLTPAEVDAVVHGTADWISLGRPCQRIICPQGEVFPESSTLTHCPAHGHQLVPSLVAGRYQIDGLIGAGGMGVVYQAFDHPARRYVALKLLLREYWQDDAVRETLIREAQVASTIDHPGVGKVLDFGADARVGLFVAAEYIPGVTVDQDLDHVVAQGRWYPWPRLRSILLQAAEAVVAIHAAGVLHRDLKPDNLLLVDEVAGSDAPDPRVKVIDFGISAPPGLPAAMYPETAVFAWAPAYSSPEQSHGQPVDARTDVYSLGAIFYELVTGVTTIHPVEASEDGAVICGYKLKHETVPLPAEVHPELRARPAALDLLGRMLACDPAGRPASAAAVLEALRRVL